MEVVGGWYVSLVFSEKLLFNSAYRSICNQMIHSYSVGLYP